MPVAFGDVRDHVRPDALPGRDLGADARLAAPPRRGTAPQGQLMITTSTGLPCVDDAELAVAVERDRAQVALRQAVRADQLVARRAQLLDRVRQLHVEQPRRVVQALQVLGEPEDRRARSASRSSGCPRRRPCRSGARGRRRGSSRRPSRRARRSSRSSRSPASHSFLSPGRRDGAWYVGSEVDDVHRLGAGEPDELARRERGHVRGRAGADPDERLREQGLLAARARRAAAGTARRAPGAKPVASRRTSCGGAIARLLAPAARATFAASAAGRRARARARTGRRRRRRAT